MGCSSHMPRSCLTLTSAMLCNSQCGMSPHHGDSPVCDYVTESVWSISTRSSINNKCNTSSRTLVCTEIQIVYKIGLVDYYIWPAES